MQSAYGSNHFTEIALLRVHHGIVYAIAKTCCVALIMLDLSDVFDVIDHTTLSERLSFFCRFSDSALQSYLKKKTEFSELLLAPLNHR